MGCANSHNDGPTTALDRTKSTKCVARPAWVEDAEELHRQVDAHDPDEGGRIVSEPSQFVLNARTKYKVVMAGLFIDYDPNQFSSDYTHDATSRWELHWKVAHWMSAVADAESIESVESTAGRRESDTDFAPTTPGVVTGRNASSSAGAACATECSKLHLPGVVEVHTEGSSTGSDV